MKKKIILVFIFAFLIRLIALNQSLWLDEGVTAKVISQFSYWTIITKFSPHDFHPPSYYLFLKFWSNIVGYSEISLRFPSIIFSLLTGYLVYKITSLFHDSIASVWAAVFFLFNPLIIYYSQEARMYMMVTFFLTAALYYFILNIKNQSLGRTQDDPKRNRTCQILFNLFIFLSLITFYGSAFLVATFLLYFLYKKQYKNLFTCLLVIFVYFLTISSLLYKQLVNSKITLNNVVKWTLVLGKANFKNLLLIPVKFSIGRIDFYPKWLYYAIAGIWTGFVIYQLLKNKYQNDKSKIKNVFLFTYLFIFPLFLGFVTSFFVPMLQYFRFIYLIPIMSILLIKKNTTIYYYTVAIGFIIFSLAYLLNPAFYREDWKSLAQFVKNRRLVYMVAASSDTLKYYNPNIKVNELLKLDKSQLEKDITIIPNTVEIYNYDYKKILIEKNYHLIKEKSFRELSLEEWEKIN